MKKFYYFLLYSRMSVILSVLARKFENIFETFLKHFQFICHFRLVMLFISVDTIILSHIVFESFDYRNLNSKPIFEFCKNFGLPLQQFEPRQLLRFPLLPDLDL